MGRFTLPAPSQIRGDQLVDEINAALGLSLTIFDAVYYPPDQVDIPVSPDQEAAAQAVIDAHVPRAVYNAADQKRVNAGDARTRFDASALKGKTPAEIYTLVQGRIDGWGSLAQAKSDLREWLPLMAAAIAWLVVERES